MVQILEHMQVPQALKQLPRLVSLTRRRADYEDVSVVASYGLNRRMVVQWASSSGGAEIINGGVLSADVVSFVPLTQTLQVDPSLVLNVGQDLATSAPFKVPAAAYTTSSSNLTSHFLLLTPTGQ
jgi:hypothetical protein